METAVPQLSHVSLAQVQSVPSNCGLCLANTAEAGTLMAVTALAKAAEVRQVQSERDKPDVP